MMETIELALGSLVPGLLGFYLVSRSLGLTPSIRLLRVEPTPKALGSVVLVYAGAI